MGLGGEIFENLQLALQLAAKEQLTVSPIALVHRPDLNEEANFYLYQQKIDHEHIHINISNEPQIREKRKFQILANMIF